MENIFEYQRSRILDVGKHDDDIRKEDDKDTSLLVVASYLSSKIVVQWLVNLQVFWHQHECRMTSAMAEVTSQPIGLIPIRTDCPFIPTNCSADGFVISRNLRLREPTSDLCRQGSIPLRCQVCRFWFSTGNDGDQSGKTYERYWNDPVHNKSLL